MRKVVSDFTRNRIFAAFMAVALVVLLGVPATLAVQTATSGDSQVVSVDESATLPECNCGTSTEVNGPFDHEATCNLNPGNMSYEQARMLWESYTGTEKAEAFAIGWFSEAQWDYIFDEMGSYAIFNPDNVDSIFVADDYQDSANSAFLDLEDLDENFVMILEDYAVDGAGGLWYKVAPADGYAMPENFEGCSWILQSYYDVIDAPPTLIFVDQPSTPSLTASEGGITVTVEGEELPLDGRLALDIVDVDDPSEFGIADATSIVAALDIKVLNADETEWQPSEGSEVWVSFDAEGMGLSDGAVVDVHHKHAENAIATLRDRVVINGLISFTVDGFSIFLVSYAGDTSRSTPIDTVNDYGMVVGSEPEFFYWTYNSYGVTQNNQNIWSVSDPNGAISYEVYSNGYNTSGNDWRHRAPWIKVTPLKAGTATLTISYVRNNSLRSETFRIVVTDPASGFYVANDIADTGCLKPMGLSLSEGQTVSYSWSRSDGKAVRSDAVTDEGWVNVSLDRGGISNDSLTPVKYTVVATVGLAGGSVVATHSASYEVPYGIELLNPNFEEPDIVDTFGDYPNVFAFNGYPGLYWRTTAPGNSSDILTRDIELIREGSDAASSYGVGTAREGEQFAELNAENTGALYQDILTTPGSSLVWSASHAGRSGGDSNNRMYIFAAAASDAQDVETASDISSLISAAKNAALSAGVTIPSNGPGFSFQYLDSDNDVSETYYVWYHSASAGTWRDIGGHCPIPPGQYLTRLFFASDTTNSGTTSTKGNLLDRVDATESMAYRIRYKVDGPDVSTATETGAVEAHTVLMPENLDDYLSGRVITSVTVNGYDYSGDITEGLYVTEYPGATAGDYPIDLVITLKQKAITVTKTVMVEGWGSMSMAEKSAFANALGETYEASFALYDENNEKVSTASVAIVASGMEGKDGVLTAVVEFNKAANSPASFTPKTNESYTVKEESAEQVQWCEMATTYTYNGVTTEGSATGVRITAGSLIANVVCTNVYKPGSTSLKITKSVDGAASGETFLFGVYEVDGNGTGSDKLIGEVVIAGEGSVTIDGLAIGKKYRVVEAADWSWRYSQTSVNDSDNTTAAGTVKLAATGNEVTFTNDKANNKWLDWSDWCRNVFNGSNVVVTPGDEK